MSQPMQSQNRTSSASSIPQIPTPPYATLPSIQTHYPTHLGHQRSYSSGSSAPDSPGLRQGAAAAAVAAGAAPGGVRREADGYSTGGGGAYYSNHNYYTAGTAYSAAALVSTAESPGYTSGYTQAQQQQQPHTTPSHYSSTGTNSSGYQGHSSSSSSPTSPSSPVQHFGGSAAASGVTVGQGGAYFTSSQGGSHSQPGYGTTNQWGVQPGYSYFGGEITTEPSPYGRATGYHAAHHAHHQQQHHHHHHHHQQQARYEPQPIETNPAGINLACGDCDSVFKYPQDLSRHRATAHSSLTSPTSSSSSKSQIYSGGGANGTHSHSRSSSLVSTQAAAAAGGACTTAPKKTFPCPYCGKHLSRRDAVKRHVVSKQCPVAAEKGYGWPAPEGWQPPSPGPGQGEEDVKRRKKSVSMSAPGLVGGAFGPGSSVGGSPGGAPTVYGNGPTAGSGYANHRMSAGYPMKGCADDDDEWKWSGR